MDYGIVEPLCGLAGDAQRGSKIASDGSRGNCLACHQLPIPDVEAYGTIGPPLAGIASRLSVPQIRLRVVDTRNINPMSIMPGFYRDPRLINRPGKKYRGRTFLHSPAGRGCHCLPGDTQMMRFNRTTLLLCALLLAFPATAALAGEAKSGYDYIKPASRAMQDDEFENPGMIAVERGQQPV